MEIHLNPLLTDVLTLLNTKFDIIYSSKIKIGGSETSIHFTYDEYIKHNLIASDFTSKISSYTVKHKKFPYAEYVPQFYITFGLDNIIYFNFKINKKSESIFTFDEFLIFIPKFFILIDNAYENYLSAALLFDAYKDPIEKRLIISNNILNE